jgi:hypothetical protein
LDADYNAVFGILSKLGKRPEISSEPVKVESLSVDSENKALEPNSPDDTLLAKRDLPTFDGETSTPDPLAGDPAKNVGMKHLVFFLENDRKFKKSKHLFKAYTMSTQDPEPHTLT